MNDIFAPHPLIMAKILLATIYLWFQWDNPNQFPSYKVVILFLEAATETRT